MPVNSAHDGEFARCAAGVFSHGAQHEISLIGARPIADYFSGGEMRRQWVRRAREASWIE